MIIWKGWGILTVAVVFVRLLAGSFLTGGSGLDSNGPVVGASVLVSAIANWFLGRHFNEPLRQGGVAAYNRHGLFWIPMDWWSAPLAAAGLYMILVG